MVKTDSPIRVRFAPSPTGLMHLGNVRSALMNYLFARAKGGTFIVRIEDTDAQRNFDVGATGILENLAWLGLTHDEGPGIGGKYGPYYQSERSEIYKEYLNQLIEKKSVYRCFCSPEELEIKRERQIALKKAPRYDRTCAHLKPVEIEQKLATKTPFVWRFAIKQEKTSFVDMARGTMDFDLAHFSDFPLTRADGSFTFIFANCVDDIAMEISHVFRGHEHLSNTVHQMLLYEAFGAKIPVFWHLPLLFGANGKKLSKRDFGFSLNDLIQAGFTAPALTNYLGIIGASFANEIMSLEQLAKNYPFDSVPTSSTIKYDVEKLRWVNSQWLKKLTLQELTTLAVPFIAQKYPQILQLTSQQQELLIGLGKGEYNTLADIVTIADVVFSEPIVSYEALKQAAGDAPVDAILALLYRATEHLETAQTFTDYLKKEAVAHGIPGKSLWPVIRILLTGAPHGYHVGDLVTLLGKEKVNERIKTQSTRN